MLVELSVQLRPCEVNADRFTVPVNPFIDWREMVEFPATPASIVIELGLEATR